jgi:uncharacterized membrane protein YkvA (DUF1232 family)
MTNNASYGSTGSWSLTRITQDLASAWRLFWDPRVPTALKVLLPVAALVYWVSPIDLLPGLPIDDIAVLILALRMFVMMAPATAKNDTGANANGADSGDADGDVIDTTWRVIDE